MGSKDFRKREAKKQKKDNKKIAPVSTTILTPPPEVEVIKTKGKKFKEGEEEEE